MKTVIYYLFMLLILIFATTLISTMVKWYSPQFPDFWLFGFVLFAVGATALFGWKENKVTIPYSQINSEVLNLRKELANCKLNLQAKEKNLQAVTDIAKNNKAKVEATEKLNVELQSKYNTDVSNLENQLAKSNDQLANCNTEIAKIKQDIEHLNYLQQSADFYDKLTKEFPNSLKIEKETIRVAKWIKDNELLFIGSVEQQLEVVKHLSAVLRGKMTRKEKELV
jgi:chromosome segregation ATPase